MKSWKGSLTTLLVIAVLAAVLPAGQAAESGERRRSAETGSDGNTVPVRPLGFARDGDNLIRLAGGAFDPVDERAPLAMSAVDESTLDPQAPAYWLVQVETGRVADAVRSVRRAGGIIAGYVPDHAFMVRATLAQRLEIDAAAGVRWTGLYQPGWKVAPRTDTAPGLLDLDGQRTYRVFIFSKEPRPGAARAAITAIDGVSVLAGGSRRVLVVRATSARVPAIASVPAVEWVGLKPRAVPLNMNARWVTDTGVRDVYSATAVGRLDGSGQTAGVADTAINYVTDPNDKAQAYFRDCASGSTGCKLAEYTQVNSGSDEADLENVQDNNTNHRKLSAYFDIGGSGAEPPDAGSHGTHVAGSVTGDLRGNRTWDLADGMAPGARLVHQNISDEGGGLSLPADTYELLSQSYRPRNPASVPETWTPADYFNYRPSEDARTHNNSYGLIVPIIDLGDATRFDQFVWDHEDMVGVISAGNSGPAPGTVGSPSVAKNTFTSGASANGRQPMASIDSMASFSSHGPTGDGRQGVTVATPGQIVISARGGGAAEEHTLQGTSMSAPVLTGLATLTREYFFDGFGPDDGRGFARGVPISANRHNPSAALVKAAIINGAVRMRGYYTGNNGADRAEDGQWPSFGQGFGRVNLANSLFFPGDDLNNWFYDVWRNDSEAFDFPAAGPQQRTYTLEVRRSRPFDVTLAWTDAPDLLPVGSPAIVNNLDLMVTAPDGTTYFGNNFNTEVNPEADVATSVPGGPDTSNVEERVRIASPAAGEYTITVSAPQTFDGPQGFALAASGALTGDAPARGAGLLPDEPGSPDISKVKIERVTNDTAWVRWRTDEPTTGEVSVLGPGGSTVYVDSYNSGSDGYPCYGSGPTETSEEYADKPMLGTRHEALLTCLDGGTTYDFVVRATDRAGNMDVSNRRSFRAGVAVYGAHARDIGQLARESGPSWRTGTQLYTGRFAPGDETLGAFMFRLPSSVDASRVVGAAVQLQSYHDITNTYTDDSRLVVDLLDESVEPEWGTQTYDEIREADNMARLNPEMADREGGLTPYTYGFDCREIQRLRETLANEDGGQRKAAFRALNLTQADESLFSYEFGFNRRTRGPQNRPRLILYLDDGDGGMVDPLDCDPNTPAPAISDVRVAPGLDEDSTTTVSWKTDVDSDSTVLFREQGDTAWTQVRSPVRTTHHMVQVHGLDSSTEYEFAVRSQTCNGKVTTDTNGGAGYDFFLEEGDPGTRTEIASYGFETGAEGWTTDSQSSNPAAVPWERRSPGHSSEFAWYLEPYLDEEDERLISPGITFPGGAASVRFFNRRDTEPGFDYLRVEYSTDGGTTWKQAAAFDGQNGNYPSFSGEDVRFDAPAGALKIRFRFTSDAFISFPPYNGVGVDDVSVATVAGATEGETRLTEGAPAPSAGESGLDPPATRRRPTEADLEAGTSACAPVSFGGPPEKRPGVRLQVSDRTPRRGQRIEFYVRLQACRRSPSAAARLAGTDVILQRKRDGEWTGIARKELDARCKATFARRADFREAHFRAVWPKQLEDYRRGQSRPRGVTTHR